MTNTSYQQKISYDSLFGKMVPDENDGKYDFEFYLGSGSIQVTAFPEGSTNRTFYQGGSNTSYPNSEEDLKYVANGTY